MLNGAKSVVTIVGFRNADDVSICLSALSKMKPPHSFAIFICENGGPTAFDRLMTRLLSAGGPCVDCRPVTLATKSEDFVRVRGLRLGPCGPPVYLADARENFGYAGGINAWIRVLTEVPGWEGLWVLNPDTIPEPLALVELATYAELRKKGMVGSRLMFVDNPNIVRSRGLKWRRHLASTLAVDLCAPVDPPPDSAEVEARIDAPSGASLYITRACLERIGPMDERYFLFYEDLDWGLRAKASCGIGYAFDSVVPHRGGTSIGSARRRADRSTLAVYLEFRNRLLFVKRHFPRWYGWTVLITYFRASEFLCSGGFPKFRVAVRGIAAGLRGEVGRPDLSDLSGVEGKRC